MFLRFWASLCFARPFVHAFLLPRFLSAGRPSQRWAKPWRRNLMWRRTPKPWKYTADALNLAREQGEPRNFPWFVVGLLAIFRATVARLGFQEFNFFFPPSTHLLKNEKHWLAPGLEPTGALRFGGPCFPNPQPISRLSTRPPAR